MREHPLISVIVPVYNVEKYLPKCVDSILAQTYDNLEIILVEDGTKDNSGAICDEYARKDSRIRVIHKENGGLSSARNAGMDIARGEYFGFVDSDDWIEPEMYETLLNLADKYDADMVCGSRYDVEAATGVRTLGLHHEKEECLSSMEMLGRVFTWNGCDSAAWDKLYHRSLFSQIRYPFGKICEDLPTTYRIGLDAGRVGMIAKPVYNYFHRAGSITTASMSDARLHVLEHTEFILKDIAQRCPQLLPYARSFRLRQAMMLLQRIEIGNETDRSKYLPVAAELKKELRRDLGTVLSDGRITARKKAELLMMLLGVYRPLRKLFYKVSGRQ